MSQKEQVDGGVTITFYSYKGGVGRSMALANVACLLSEEEILSSRRVLIIDWDLEAPGLHKFFPVVCDRPENIAKPGVVEYFNRLNVLLHGSPSLHSDLIKEDGWQTLDQVLPLENYLIRDVHPGIDLVKAGVLDSKYAERVASFDWVRFFHSFGGSIETFRSQLTNTYSYCLIDSRTGFTDTSGICTMLLPEKLVVVFTPNKQSSQGAADLAERAIRYRRSSRDLRPLAIFPVPSRVDDAEEELRKKWREEYQDAFERVFQTSYDLETCDLTSYFDEVKLPYKSRFAYGEGLAVLEERNEALTLHRSYKSFSELLTKLETPWDPFDPVEARTKEPIRPRASEVSVFISSSLRDLPDHREQVTNACMRLGMFQPTMMEHLTARETDALELSLKMVDEADIYLGVFGFRYGYVPAGQAISITEAEYQRALERGIPRLIFLMSDEHPVRATDVETGRGADQLRNLKERLKKQQVINLFNSPDDLRAQVIQALAAYRQPDLTSFHYVSDIPTPPEPFIAHPYTLLQRHRLVGRQRELNLLTNWVADSDSEIHKACVLNIVAIGGLGKSALAWKWFNDITQQELKPLAGRMWWSFHESDATFENFIIRALAYVTRRPLTEVQQIPPAEREAQLLATLDHDSFLIVLDGLERILIAYARMDAAHLGDDDSDEQPANFANASGLPASAAQSFTGEHRLRKTADPRAGAFLRKLANVRASRILISTRLYPADLQTAMGEPLGTCAAIFLKGLADDDALDLWRSFGATGSRESLLPLFQLADNHPLLIQALANEVARYRPAPGDFDAWRRAHPDFDPFSLPLIQVKLHVLAFALHVLDDKAQQILRTIAAFRMPARYDTLAALLIGEGKPCADEHELDEVLTELEDRGLVGWDKRANRYDLHPIVRGVVWSGLGDDTRRGVYASLHAHFEAVPIPDRYLQVNSLEELTPAIELYSTLIGLGRYDDAERLFYHRLEKAILYRLGASRQIVELLELLFPDGLEQLPRLDRQGDQAYAFNTLALGYQLNGQPGRAAALYRRHNTIRLEIKDKRNLSVGLYNLSETLRLSGALCESESAARRALVITCELDDRFGEAISLRFLGLTLAARGVANESQSALQRSLRLFISQSNSQGEGFSNSYLAQRALWLGEFAGALSFANRAWQLAHVLSLERDFIRAARAQGEAALGLNDLATAEERMHHALTRARMVNLVEEELPALVALAELRRRQGDAKAARELLDDVWELAERGPYPLFHADAFNVLAQIERDEGNTQPAIEAATKAYRLAWCDGPPFAYHWGLEKAKQHLKELGAPEPEMPPFDASKFEPMPEVEIDPDDEFHVGSNDEVPK